MKALFAFFVGVLSLAATAQGTYKCTDNYKEFEGKFLAREYNDAYKIMNELRLKCPKVDENLYVFGETILKYLIETAPADGQKPFVEDLVAMYGQQYTHYPASDAGVKKIQLQLDNKIITRTEAYKAFDAQFEKNRPAFTDYNSLAAYFEMILDSYKDKGLTDDQYFDKYTAVYAQINAAKARIAGQRDAISKKGETTTLKESEIRIDALETVGEIVQKQSRSVVSCEKLEAHFSKGFEGHKDDKVWIEGMVDVLYGKKCYNSDMLSKGALLLHQQKPTKQTAYIMGVVSLKKNNIKEAAAYFEQSASMETSAAKKTEIYYEIAGYARNSDKAMAKQFYLKSVELNPKFAKSYIALAEMYSAVRAGDDCKLNDFERSALNYVSLSLLDKAEAADVKYKAAVDAARERYMKNLPTKAAAKVLGKKKGDVITFGCWINESVTLPNLK